LEQFLISIITLSNGYDIFIKKHYVTIEASRRPQMIYSTGGNRSGQIIAEIT
jgi:hypothetical protein